MTTILRSAFVLPLLLALATGGARADDGTAFCGRATGEPAAILADVSKAAGFKEVHHSPEYIAYQDPATEAVFTFTQEAAGPAHPAAVCRKPVKQGDDLVLQMVTVCRGDESACQRLESDFKLLNAQMEAAIRNQGKPGSDQK